MVGLLTASVVWVQHKKTFILNLHVCDCVHACKIKYNNMCTCDRFHVIMQTKSTVHYWWSPCFPQGKKKRLNVPIKMIINLPKNKSNKDTIAISSKVLTIS